MSKIDDFQKLGAKDTYIALMSDEQRKAAKISDEDIKRLGPLILTPEEKKVLFSSISFERILFLYAKSSLGKTDLELEGFQNSLKQLNDWMGQLNNAMAYATERNAKKEEKDRTFFLWDEKFNGNKFENSLRDILKKFGSDKIDIKIFFGREEGQGMHTEKGIPPNLAIEKLRNIITMLDNEVKTLSTKIQKANSEHNTLLETMSFITKKISDIKAAMLRF